MVLAFHPLFSYVGVPGSNFPYNTKKAQGYFPAGKHLLALFLCRFFSLMLDFVLHFVADEAAALH